MPVIFVHGVNNRKESPGYEAGRQVTATFLQRHLGGVTLDGRTLPAGITPSFPYWGDLATVFAWGMRSLPSSEMDALGGALSVEMRPVVALIKDALANAGSAVSEPLVTVAKGSFPLAIDVLCEVLITAASDQSAGDVADFVVQAQTYASRFEPPQAPPWLSTVSTDAQFVTRLVAELQAAAPPAVEALGVLNRVGNALSAAALKLKQAVGAARTKVLDNAGDFASTKALAWSRASLNETLGRFFGDVFVYMHGRGTATAPGPIPSRLLAAWDEAVAAAPGEPVVIVGHSLGGVIAFDLLTHFRPAMPVDLFISVGSQVSHFEEMKLFLASDASVPAGDFTKRATKPDHVRHWINVFDEVDIFSYSCARVFAGVHDFHYDTRTYVIKAHGAYFTQARFYERLRARIDRLA